MSWRANRCSVVSFFLVYFCLSGLLLLCFFVFLLRFVFFFFAVLNVFFFLLC